MFLVLLCNDKDVLGPWVNRPWLNAVAGVIIGVLVLLFALCAVTARDAVPVACRGGQLTALVADAARPPGAGRAR